MISTFGALNGWILLQGRVPLAAAEDGLFPGRVREGARQAATPVFGLVVSSVLVTALMLMNYTKGLVDAVHLRHPAGHADDARALRVPAAAQAYLYVTERELFAAALRARRRHRRARVRLLGLGDRRLRPGDHRQGLRLMLAGHPDLRG